MKFLNLAPDETVTEWIISVLFIIFAIIAVLLIDPPDPPPYHGPSEQKQVEVINEH